MCSCAPRDLPDPNPNLREILQKNRVVHRHSGRKTRLSSANDDFVSSEGGFFPASNTDNNVPNDTMATHLAAAGDSSPGDAGGSRNTVPMPLHRVLLDAASCADAARATCPAASAALRRDGNVSALRADLALLETAARPLLARRDAAAALLASHAPLAALLRIPTLARVLAAHDHFDDAVALHAHVRRFARRLPNDPTVSAVAASVERIRPAMLHRLLILLRDSTALPRSIKIISFLRRLDLLSETDLRVAFLQCRHHALIRAADSINEQTPFNAARRSIDLYRDTLCDILAQYCTLFPVSRPNDPTQQPKTPQQHSHTIPLDTDGWAHAALLADLQYKHDADVVTRRILTSYTDYVLDLLRRRLLGRLVVADCTQLAALHTQCVYLAHSLEHLGLRLGNSVFELLNDALLRFVDNKIATDMRELNGWLNTAIRSIGDPTSNTGPELRPLLGFLAGLQQLPPTGTTTTSPSPPPAETNKVVPVGGTELRETMSPPESLVQHPILAVVCNVIFATLNQVRVLPAKEIENELTRFILAKLQDIRHSLDLLVVKYVVPHSTSLISGKHAPPSLNPDDTTRSRSPYKLAQVDSFFGAFDTILVPAVNDALRRLFLSEASHKSQPKSVISS